MSTNSEEFTVDSIYAQYFGDIETGYKSDREYITDIDSLRTSVTAENSIQKRFEQLKKATTNAQYLQIMEIFVKRHQKLAEHAKIEMPKGAAL